MISDRKRTYLISALLAVPPVALAGVLASSLFPQPESVPAVVSANDPEVASARVETATAPRSSFFQLAKSLH